MPTTFEDRLLDELLADPPVAVAPSRKPIARRIAPFAAIAMVGAGVAVVSHDGGGTLAAHAPITHAPKSTIDLTDAKAVLAATTAAIDNAAYGYEMSKQTGVNGDDQYEAWWQPDGRALRFRYSLGGTVQYDESFDADKVAVTRYVDFVTKTWSDHAPHGDYWIITMTDWRGALDRGEMTVVANETLDGVAVTHLRGSDTDVWVDSTTFLPVKTSFASPASTQVGTWKWIPQAEAKPDDYAVPIPEGFTKAG